MTNHAYPDTSFLCGLYVQQSSSEKAIAYYDRMKEPLAVTALLLYEFRHAARFQTFRFSNDRTTGNSKKATQDALSSLQKNIDAGAVVIVPVDWSEIIARAEKLSAQFTMEDGQCPFDVLHVATALELGAKEFLTFDKKQAELARATGLKVKP